MSKSPTLIAIAGAVLTMTAGQCLADPLKTMDEVGTALSACWTPPSDVKESAVTLSFSFKRDGSLIGPPQPTAIDVKGDDAAKKAFTDAAIAAVEQCMPLQFAPALAEGIAGTVYTMAFTSSDN